MTTKPSRTQPHAKGRTKTTKICEHCQVEYFTYSETSRYAPGHAPRKTKVTYQKKQDYDTNMRIGQTVPERAKPPTVEAALKLRPSACGKCGIAVGLFEDFVPELVQANNGRGIGWACFLCGWRTVAFKGGYMKRKLSCMACWECARKFRGPFYTVVLVAGLKRYVHGDCAQVIEREGRGEIIKGDV